MSPFSYENPLRDSQASLAIRLIDLSPGSGDSRLECQLRQVSLTENPEYEAISYCWGVDLASETIFCDGSPLLISRNLHDSLRQFRAPDRVKSLWADAICINQDDVEEKSNQVALMGKIYSQASTVNVWLGPASETSIEAARLIAKLVRLARQFSEEFSAPLDEIRNLDSPQWAQARTYKAAERASAYWDPVFLLCRNPWFRRAWIVQEVALSYHRARLCCGDTVVPWPDFVVAIFFCFQAPVRQKWTSMADWASTRESVNRVLSLCQTTAVVNLNLEAGGDGIGLRWLLTTGRSAAATDPRDKVYSVLGMARNGDPVTPGAMLITPDYSLSTAQVYQQVAELFLRRYPKLHLPINAGPAAGEATRNNLDLPSWVTDWSHPLMSSPKDAIDIDERLERGAAGRYNACLTDTYPKVYQVEGKALVLSGQIVDEITEVNLLLDSTWLEADHRGLSVGQQGMLSISVLHQVNKMWQCSLGKSYPHTGEASLEAFLKTWFLDDIPEIVTAAGTNTEIASALLKMAKRASHLQGSLVGRSRLGLTAGLSVLGMASLKTVPTEVFGAVMEHMFNDLAFATQRGYFGKGPSSGARVGDSIVLVRGAELPMILRPAPDGCWTRVGIAYVHGIMDGEAFDIDQCQEIRII